MKFIYTKGFIIFFLSLSLIFGLFVLDYKGLLEPAKSVILHSPQPVISLFKAAVSPVKTFFLTVYNLHGIVKENAQLRQQNEQLMLDSAELDRYKFENATLREELGFVSSSKLDLVACSVLSENPVGISNTIVLNCGTNKGLQIGMGVLSQGFLVGKVVFVNKDFSTAMLLTNSQFSTDAKVSKTSDKAVVKGSFGSGFILDELPQSSDLQNGWLISTAGINGEIPKDIPIGQVANITSNPNDLFKKATLSSPINFDNLDFIFVAK